MSDEKKKDTSRLHPETFFLPPLKMVLAFFDKESRQREQDKKEAAGAAEKQEKPTEKDVEKLIEKLSEKEDE
jgi:hypothetical protein